jgi:hypothetical protein
MAAFLPQAPSNTLILDGTTDVFTNVMLPLAGPYEVVRFEPGATVQAFARKAFAYLRSLQSILIPASVQVIGEFCFSASGSSDGPSRLDMVTFESGSKLAQIDQSAFEGCIALRTIRLPASVEYIHPTAFRHSGLSRIDIDAGSQHFAVRGDLFLSIQPTLSVVCYVGTNPVRAIDDDIDKLGCSCLSDCQTLQEVRFGSASLLTAIDERAFCGCTFLTSICIPSSVRTFGRSCFAQCDRLSDVSFVSGAVLEAVPIKAFRGCKSLARIVIPASVVRLSRQCFLDCSALAEVVFESGSVLARLGSFAFQGCEQLRSISLPPSVIYIARLCFYGCFSLSRLTLSSPSKVVELGSFPKVSVEPFDVPDSVEICDLWDFDRRGDHPVLNFGRESKLHWIRVGVLGESEFRAAFARVPSSVVKRLRDRLEFAESGSRWPPNESDLGFRDDDC